jgi:4-amino-4-deoxy-L-arabinose transferase-like glycosyltransferase
MGNALESTGQTATGKSRIRAFLRSEKVLLLLLLVGLLTHLYGIDNTVLDRQGWRQADTAMIARNYYEQGMDFFRPEVDWNGDNGVVQCEFPLVPYLAALLYKIFGLHIFLARLVSVLFALGAMVYLFRLAQRLFDRPTAAFATLFFAVLPFTVCYTRNVQPESAMLFFTLAGFTHLIAWLDRNRPVHFGLSALFFSLLFLVKVPNLFLGLHILFLFQRRMGWRLFLRPSPWAFAVFLIMPVVGWTFYSHTLLRESGLSFFNIWDKIAGPVHGEEHIYPLYWKYYYRIYYTRFWVRNLLVGGLFFFVRGFFFREEKPYRGFLLWWMLSVLVFMFGFAQAHYVHDYYQLPLFLPVVILMGAAAADLWTMACGLTWKKRIRKPILLLGAAAILLMIPVGFHQMRRWYRTKDEVHRFCTTIDRSADPKAMVLVDTVNPEYFYYIHRKGFRLDFPYQDDKSALESIRIFGKGYYYATNWGWYDGKPEVRAYLLEHGRLILEQGRMRLYELKEWQGNRE